MAFGKALPKAVGGVAALTLAGLAGIRALESLHVARIWRSLEAGQAGAKFSEGRVRHLPEPVQRYFHHAITPGAPLCSRVSLKMSGRIQTSQNSSWLPFTATEIIAPHRGFVWKARARKGPVFLEVVDHYAHGAGRMRVTLCGLVPIMSSRGPDLSRSALGRLMAESVLVPSYLLTQGASIWEATDDHHIAVTIPSGAESTTLFLTIDGQGGLQQVSLQRYGYQRDTGDWAYIPFGMDVEEESTFGAYTIPSKLRGGWWYGTQQYVESIQFTIDQAVFR